MQKTILICMTKAAAAKPRQSAACSGGFQIGFLHRSGCGRPRRTHELRMAEMKRVRKMIRDLKAGAKRLVELT
jgi:hypothetical protein